MPIGGCDHSVRGEAYNAVAIENGPILVEGRGKLVITYLATHEAMPTDYVDFTGTLTIRNNNRKVRWSTWFTHANGQSPRAWANIVRVKTRYGWARLTGEFYHENGNVYSINRVWRIG